MEKMYVQGYLILISDCIIWFFYLGSAFAARFGPDDKFGTLGVFIVDKKFRGKGIGKIFTVFFCVETYIDP